MKNTAKTFNEYSIRTLQGVCLFNVFCNASPQEMSEYLKRFSEEKKRLIREALIRFINNSGSHRAYANLAQVLQAEKMPRFKMANS
jgi:hypothetical protein